MLSIPAVASSAVVGLRGLAGLLLTAWLLCSCGGGSGDSASNPSASPPAADSTKVTTSVDSSLQRTGALAVTSSLSVVETQPAGTSISAQPGAVVYGLDADGNVALAGNVVNAKVVYSATGTVLAMGTTVLQGIVPSATEEQLQARVKAADGYAALVAAVQSAVLAGKNPFDQTAVQQGFDTVLVSAARAAVQAQPVQPGTVQALKVAPTHALDVREPPVIETSTFKVVLANKSSSTPTFNATVLFKNTSTLTFDVSLLDDSGFQRTSNVLNGSGPTIFTLQGALAQTVNKPFAGSFSVRLSLNEELTQISYLKEMLEMPKAFDSTCVSGLATVAVKQMVSQLTNVTFKFEPERWGLTVIDMAWDDFKSCGVPLIAKSNVVKIVEAYFKITKIVGVGRFIADTLSLPPTILDTGVCLSQNQYLMSCISRITVDAIKPMMPSAVQPVNVMLLDAADKKTLSPPYGLKIEYSNPGLFELSSTMTTVNSNRNNLEGTGTFKITDPATDTTISRSVTVTNGKLEQKAYTVPPNGNIDVKLIDPASGIEVYRGADFNIYVADGSFGSFLPFNTTGLGGLIFHASSVITPAPQTIRFNGARDSGSTMSTEALSVGWAGTMTVTTCTQKTADETWAWEVPCSNTGPYVGAFSSSFYFDDVSDTVILQSEIQGFTKVRKQFNIRWRSADPKLVLNLPVTILYALKGDTAFRKLETSRNFEFVITERTTSQLAGIFTVRSASGIGPTYDGMDPAAFVIVPTTTSGTWTAIRASLPALRMNGFDLCLGGSETLGEGKPYIDLAKLTFQIGAASSLSWAEGANQPASGACTFGQLN